MQNPNTCFNFFNFPYDYKIVITYIKYSESRLYKRIIFRFLSGSTPFIQKCPCYSFQWKIMPFQHKGIVLRAASPIFYARESTIL